MKETIPFTIALKRIKCLGIRLTKELQGLKHCNPRREGEVKGALDKWRNIPFMDWKTQYCQDGNSLQIDQ